MMESMIIYVASAGRPNSPNFKLLESAVDVNWRLVLHDDGDYARYKLENQWLKKENVLVTRMPRKLGAQREWIRKYHKKNFGGWYANMDDNLRFDEAGRPSRMSDLIYDVPGAKAPNARGEYFTPLTIMDLHDKMVTDTVEAERRGAFHIGYATTDNPLFRASKYTDVGYCIGKLTCINTASPCEFDPQLHTDDFDFTANHLYTHGRVLVNKWIWLKKKHYSPGGIGPMAARKPWRIAEIRHIAETKWPGLFRYKGLPPDEHPAGGDLALAVRGLDGVAQWRRGMK